MARYDHLSIFQDTYQLNLYFFNLSRGFAKDFKYGLGMEVRTLLSDLLDHIVVANNVTNKAPVLQKASLVVEQIKFKVRMLKDLKIIKISSYEHFFTQLLGVSKQLKKWYGWSKKNTSTAV